MYKRRGKRKYKEGQGILLQKEKGQMEIPGKQSAKAKIGLKHMDQGGHT